MDAYKIIEWFWLLAGSALFIGMIGVSLIAAVKDNDWEPVLALAGANLLLAGLIFFSLSDIIETHSNVIILRILVAVVFLQVLFSLFLKIRGDDTDYNWVIVSSITIALFFLVITFYVDPDRNKNTISEQINVLSLTVINIVLLFWLPVFTLFFIYIIYNFSVKRRYESNSDSSYYMSILKQLSEIEDRIKYESRSKDKYSNLSPRFYEYTMEEINERLFKRITEIDYKIESIIINNSKLVNESNKDLLKMFQKELLKNSNNDKDNNSSIDKILNKDIVYQINDYISTKISNIITENFEELNNRINKLFNSVESNSINKNEDSSLINGLVSIKELFHYLMTPLSQIEANIEIISLSASNIETSRLNERLSSIKTSVELCKSVLSAYRENSLFRISTDDWSPSSIDSSIRSISNLYIERYGKNINLELGLSDVYPLYSNNYIVAMLLPLIENAIFAAIDESTVGIASEYNDTHYTFTIYNQTAKRPSVEEFFKPGYTSKANHQGNGLSIAKGLVEKQNGASISVSYSDNIVRFNIKLPLKATSSHV